MKRILAALATALIASIAPVTHSYAEPSGPVNFSGAMGPFFRDNAAVAIPAYHVTFITQQQGTAAASIGARTRLNAVLAGVDEAAMRALTNEAYADLVTQLQAAGVSVTPAEQARALTAGMELVPGNAEIKGVGAGITIGRSVKRGYASYGADAAPLLVAFHNPGSQTGGPMGFGGMSGANTLGRAARAAGASAMIPQLTIDFINMEASNSFGVARVGGEVAFSIRMASGAVTAGQGRAGPGYQQGVRMTRDVSWSETFATVHEGGAEVREGSMVPVPDENYIMEARARGDAINVDLPVWQGLVREAYRIYNAALVAQIVRAKG